jgi:hypothetical protein
MTSGTEISINLIIYCTVHLTPSPAFVNLARIYISPHNTRFDCDQGDISWSSERLFKSGCRTLSWSYSGRSYLFRSSFQYGHDRGLEESFWMMQGMYVYCGLRVLRGGVHASHSHNSLDSPAALLILSLNVQKYRSQRGTVTVNCSCCMNMMFMAVYVSEVAMSLCWNKWIL